MKNPFRRKNFGKPIAEYTVEPPAVAMRIMRTHMAAHATELGNIRHEVARIADRLESVRPVCEHAPDGGNHPVEPS